MPLRTPSIWRFGALTVCLLAVLAAQTEARTVSGVVQWSGTGVKVANAKVILYDNDVIGKEFMGSAITSSTGTFSIWYDGSKNWDSCCFGATNPDLVLEVYVNNVLMLTTSEASDVTSDRTYTINLVARTISGTVQWSSGQRVSGAVVKAWDNDAVGRESMGQATTSSTGTFTIQYNPSQQWDSCCGSSTYPDIVLEVWVNGVLWLTTGETSDVTSDRTFTLTLVTRTISGTLTWAGTSTRIPNAIIYAYDNDVIGREFMGQATTSSTGTFSITYNPQQQWDSCCGSSTQPDIVLEVYVGGNKWLTTGETTDATGSTVHNLALTRITVSGTAYWHETCAPASGLLVSVRDDDTVSYEAMGTTTTSSAGTYSVDINYKSGGTSDWDLCCGSDTNPDIYSAFLSGSTVKGQTGVSGNLAVTAGRSAALAQGTTWLWRGDSTPGASTTQSKLQLDTVDWVEIEEFNSCSPRKIRASIIVNFQRNGDMSDAMYEKLKALAKKGIAENWSRTGARAVTLSNGYKYDVITQVVERSSGHNVEVEHILDKECKRSNNVGSVAFFDFDPVIYYNEGCWREKAGANWEANADYSFIETAGHEFGHSILRASPPSWVSREWFGPFPLSLGQSWSWTHKGTSSILQDVLKSSPTYPATGDWDLMLYYNGSPQAGAYDRSFAAEDDVRRMVGIAKVKRARGGSCACPT